MKPRTLIVPFAICMLAGLTTGVRAQSDAADALVTVDIQSAVVNVTNTSGLDFGQPYAADGILRSSVLGIAAAWTVDVLGADQVELSFSLPPELVGPNPGDLITIQWGSESGSLVEGANPPLVFDPATPINQAVAPTGSQFDVFLGADANNNGTGDVVINILNATAGLYQATATLTVTVL